MALLDELGGGGLGDNLLRALSDQVAATPPPTLAPGARFRDTAKSLASNFLLSFGEGMRAGATAPGGRGTAAGIAASLQAPQMFAEMQRQNQEKQKAASILQEQQGFENYIKQQNLELARMQEQRLGRQSAPSDYTLGSTRFSGATNQPLASVQGATPDAGTPEERFISLKLREAASRAGGALPPEQESQVRLAARNEWTAAGRENNPALDAIQLQLKEIQIQAAEQRLADARRAAQSGELSPTQLQSAMQIGNALKSHVAYTDMTDIYQGIQGVEIGLQQKNGFGDITAINAFQRMVDPGATVRSEDVVLLQSASSWLQKILSDYPIDKLRTGAKLPDAVRTQMETTARQLYEKRARNYNDTVGAQYKALAAGAGVPFHYIGQEFQTKAEGQLPHNFSITVGGKTYTFKDQKSLDAFKKDAGL